MTRHRHSQSMVLSRSQDGSRHRVSIHDDRDMKEREAYGPPLLMAPPEGMSNALSRRLGILPFHIWAFLRPYLSILGYLVRLNLFIVKIISLGRPCWPYMTSLQISIPLLAAAALDVGLPQRTGSSVTIHSSRTSTFSTYPRVWAIVKSLALLVLHFVVLWISSSRHALCAATPPERWPEL